MNWMWCAARRNWPYGSAGLAPGAQVQTNLADEFSSSQVRFSAAVVSCRQGTCVVRLSPEHLPLLSDLQRTVAFSWTATDRLHEWRPDENSAANLELFGRLSAYRSHIYAPADMILGLTRRFLAPSARGKKVALYRPWKYGVFYSNSYLPGTWTGARAHWRAPAGARRRKGRRVYPAGRRRGTLLHSAGRGQDPNSRSRCRPRATATSARSRPATSSPSYRASASNSRSYPTASLPISPPSSFASLAKCSPKHTPAHTHTHIRTHTHAHARAHIHTHA
jgi:hypothetical protein